jgi:flagellar biosynthesis GTPase FlhF
MSTKTTDKDAAAVANALEGNVSSSIKSSPLFGWLAAGSDLIAAKLDTAAGMVSQRIDDTHEAIQTMQAKGLEVESELKRTLNPMAIVDTAQKIVLGNPVVSALSGSKKRQKKDKQLALLNAKVDLLVEQVALLAAKEAAAKASEKAATKRTTKSAAAAKPAAKAASAKATDTKAATTKAPASKASTTRKASTTAKRSTSTAAKKTTSASGTASKRASTSTRKTAAKTQDTSANAEKGEG